jgi:hypothetical protein
MLWKSLLSFAGMFVATQSFAQPPREPLPQEMRLEYILGPGAESCPDDETLRTVVLGELQEDPFKPNATGRLVVTLSGAPRKGHVQARAEIHNAAGRVVWDRDMGPDDCQMVLNALGFAVAVALEQRPKPPVATAPRPHSDAQQAPAVNRDLHADRAAWGLPRDQPSTSRQGWGPWAVSMGGQLVYGAVPDAFAGTVDASVGYRLHLGGGFLGALSFEAQGQPPAGIELDGAHFSLSRVSGGLTPCVHWEIVYGCAVVQAGAWIGQVDAQVSGSGFDFYSAFAGRLGVEIPVYSRFSLHFHGELGSIVHHPALDLNERARWVGHPLYGALGTRVVTFLGGPSTFHSRKVATVQY